MGVPLPGLTAGLLNQSSAQVVDGSLKFQRANANYLTRAISTEGNRKTWTYSCWVKRDDFPAAARQLWGQVATAGASATGAWQLYYAANEALEIHTYSLTHLKTNAVYRDTGWYHVVQTLDTTSSDADSRCRLYINGVEQTSFSTRNNPTLDQELGVNTVGNMVIGTADNAKATYYIDAKMTQAYFIDGQQLGPENFGFTDPLTNTWRPKKLDVSSIFNQYYSHFTTSGSDNGVVSAGTRSSLFDGSDTSYVSISQSASTYAVACDNQSVVCSSTFSVRTWYGASTPTVRVTDINDVSTVFEVTSGSSLSWYDFSYTGTIKKIEIGYLGGSGSSTQFAGFKVDENYLIDGKLNSFHLPFDGNSPIGQDKSGQGNDFTPVNFGNYVDLDEATGALPILNTTQGGSQAGVGVREDSLANGDSSDPLDRVFSNYTTASGGFSDSYPKTNLFDGQAPADANRAEAATNNDPIDITFNPPITVSSTVSLWSGKSSTQYQINNSGSYTSYSDAVGSYKDISHSGSLSNIKILHGNTSYAAGISAIKIDGTQLTDVPGLVLALPLVGSAKDVSSQLRSPLPDKTLTRLRFRTDWNWMYVSAIEINGTILTTGTLDNSGAVWTDDTKWKNGSVGSGQETYSQSARGDWFDVTLASTIEFETLRIYVYLDASAGSTTNVFELELFFQDGSTLTQINPLYDDAPNGNYNQRSWQDYGDVRTKYVSVSGDPASNGTQSNFYGASFYFDGSANTDYVSVAARDELNVGSGDFTIECWAYVSGYPNTNPGLLAKRGGNGTTHWQLALNRNGQIQFGDQATWSNDFGTASGTTGDQIFKDQWHHIAITRTSGSVQAWLDGRKYGTPISNTTDFDTTANFSVGVGRESVYDEFQGYISDVRMYKGVAKYTSDFNPGTTNPVISPDSPSGVSGSSKLTKITDGAVAFDGSGDYLSTPHVASTYEWWDTPFTLEYYVYPNAFGVGDNGNTNMVGKSDPGSNPESWSFGAQADGTVEWYYWVGSQKRLTTDEPISLKKWTHLAFTCDGSNNMKIFFDGKLVKSGVIDGTPAALNTSLPFNIGKNANASFNGMISNLRMIRGTALYTSNFTPPSAPLTDVTNTKVLCCQSNTQAGAAAVSPSLGGINDGTVWSDFLSSAAAFGGTHVRVRAFDGDTSTMAGTAANTGYSITGNDTNALEFIPPSPIAYSSSVKVRGRNTGQTTMGVKIDTGSGYGSEVSLSGDDLQTVVSGSGNLVKIKVYTKTFSGENELGGIAIDDVYLTDPITVYDASPTTFNPFNTDINTVRGQETSYPTLNPLDSTLGTNLKGGNLKTVGSSSWSAAHARGTIKMTSGKWYWEGTKCGGSGAIGQFGFANSQASLTESYGAAPANSWTFYFGNGTEIIVPAANSGGYFPGSAMTDGDTAGVALDMDNGTWQFFKNGVGGEVKTLSATDSGSTASITELYPYVGSYNSDFELNFGQKPFKFSPPDGFQSLNSNSLIPENVITRPDKFVNTTLWSGDNTDPRQINLGMAPDLIWVKTRNQTNWHWLSDSLRGTVDKRYKLYSNAANAQDTAPIYGQADSFNGSGFVAGGGTDGSNPLSDSNQTGTNYVCWSWRAGGSKGTFNIDDVGYANASDVNMSVGALNSTLYNQSNRWSDDYSGATIDGSYPITQAFDGNRSTASRVSATQTAMSVDLTNITVTDRIEICGEIGYITPYVSVTVDGVTHQIGGDPDTLITGSAGTASRIITGVSGALTNVKVGRVNSGRTYLSQIIVDGKILVDDNITPQNAPSIANIGASVGTKQGFSIVKYTSNGTQGATIAHGLTQKPDFAIFKNIDSTLGVDEVDWGVYHTSIGATKHLELNQNIATGSDAGPFNNTEPTSLVFTFGGNPGAFSHSYLTNGPSGDDFIGYIWHNVPGLQKFGSYEGDTTNPAFIECGFRPAIVWIKAVDQTWYWNVQDTKRSPQNPSKGNFLRFDENYVENADSANNNIDFVSNGFKIRSTTAQSEPTNVNAQTYIYCAWAEAPSINLYGGQSNAR